MLKRRALLVGFAVVLTLGLGGCDDEFCSERDPHPLTALFRGLMCLGNRPAGTGDNEQPTASFEVNPVRVENGGTVRLDASASSDDGRIVSYRWELDGVPSDLFPSEGRPFEIDTGEEPVTQQRIFRSEPALQFSDEGRLIKLRVTDDNGRSAETQREIVISRERNPIAIFTISPNPAFVGQSVFFNGRPSIDAESWSWDLDGDGTFEVGPSQEPTISQTYTEPGVRKVQLQINAGTSEVATSNKIDVNVVANPPSGSGAAARAARRPSGRLFSAGLGRVSFPTDLGRPLRKGATTLVSPFEASGRLIARRRGLGPLRRFRRSRWVARLRLSANRRTGKARVRGLALATFPKRAGRACVRFSMATRAGRSPAGRITVLGGSGPAARLGGKGRFSFRFRDGAPRLAGRLRARAVSHRPLPAACKRLG